VTALDIVSEGRGQLGIGSGWFELEHDAFGIEFGSFTDRFEKLEEALQIILPLLRGEHVSFAGKHYQTVDAFNSPPAVSRIPVMIGGGGERKTLRMVAQYADESNLIATKSQLPRKLDALAEHCERLGRDRAGITVSWQRSACVAPTMEEAQRDLAEHFGARGIAYDTMSNDDRAKLAGRYVVGDPDTVAEVFAADLTSGIDGFTVNAPVNGHVPGRVHLLGETLSRVVSKR
jgi:alkanesulfonate monooxygenase SsuD/methylene tetrahydromethanopterin reductase-like flavin-dependent oxidoreductase (luciferase family)